MENKIMKKLDCSLSRLSSGFAVLFLIFSISNSCTKTESDGSSSGTGYSLGPGVTIQGGFLPVEIKISAGDMVTWINNSTETESVTSDQGLFDAIVRSNESYNYKFLSAGTYTYFSRMHPNLIGKVVVK